MKLGFLFLFLSFPLLLNAAEPDIFSGIRSHQERSFRNEQSLALLEKSLEQKLSAKEKSMAQFAIGYLSFELGLRDKAETYLKLALKADTELKPYTHFNLARLYLKDGQYNTAESHLQKLLKLNPQRNLSYQTRFMLGQVALAKKNYRPAFDHLRYAESTMRSDPEYPRILLDLVRTEKARGRSWRACRWARKLYSRHPHAPLIREWGVELNKVKLDGSRLGCVATMDDKKRRIMWLQLTGSGDRAREEITHLEKSLGKKEKYEVASLWAAFLLRDSDPRGALNQVLPFYKEKKGEFDYLMEVAKYSDRAAESHAAIGAYYKAFKEHKGHGRARHALFQAAFLSYQIHDYDGSLLKFQEFMDTFKRTGLRRSVSWHMAWLEYLRNNNENSLKAFEDIKRQKRRQPRYWGAFSHTRIDYWRGMNLVRLSRFEEAHKILSSIASGTDSFGYYAIAAGYRLQQVESVSGIKADPTKLSEGDEPRDLAAEPLVKVTGTEADRIEEEESDADLDTDTVDVADDEDIEIEEEEEILSAEGDSDKDRQVPNAEEVKDAPPEAVASLQFKDRKLQDYLDRAQNLMAMGFHDWARWDLYEIERRTKDKDDLKALISKYEQIGAYHRSSYIGQIYFRSMRAKKGMNEARPIWEATYPKPYSEDVVSSAKEFGIPQTMIWSIMRAESMYKPNAESPVGALGLMQVMPTTGDKVAGLLGEKNFEPESLRQSQVAIRMGTRYLKRLKDQFGNDVPLMAAAYNAGPHRVKSWLLSFGKLDMDEFIEHIPYSETRNYVKKVISHYEIYKQLYSSKEDELSYLANPVRASYKGPRPVAEDWTSI